MSTEGIRKEDQETRGVTYGKERKPNSLYFMKPEGTKHGLCAERR